MDQKKPGDEVRELRKLTMLRRAVFYAVTLVILVVICVPPLSMWSKSSSNGDDARKRMILEALIEQEIDLFRQRYGVDQLIDSSELFRRYEKRFTDRVEKASLLTDDLDPAEVLTLYSVGLVYREDGRSIQVEPLFDDPSLDKAVPVMSASDFVDRDNDRWCEISVPGLSGSVYELQEMSGGLAIRIGVK